jgi:hypothetical protein
MKRVTVDRLSGDLPGAPRALGAAIVTGTAVAVITYKLRK